MAFEDTLRQLESIVAQLESDSLSLDDALTLFEHGVALLRDASDQLTAAESRVQQLVEDADGVVTTRDLDD
jgi:exodeoxyribonuclease VII small subunit